jgi:putative membrane protein
VRLIVRWLVIAVSVAVAAYIVPGIEVGENGWVAVLVMSAVLGLVNAFIRPILSFFSCLLIIVTLGLFSLVINTGTFLLASWISQNWFRAQFSVDGFWPAFWGSIVVSVVSVVISALLPDDKDS